MIELTKYICHRIPERSFFIKGHQFPVCARCTGFYISIFSYAIYAMLFSIHYEVYSFLIGFILILPAFVDGFTQYLGIRESNNILRLLTGLLGGIGLMIIAKTIKILFLLPYII
ncbi:DUF2085 domain-containing protein [Methanobrevibacter ruminantium]|uniref:DUF2085 domain-containing protein n=1 Tax=Methanobrevibacter ruminantium TaxID=83816 RepID=UPI003F0245D7